MSGDIGTQPSSTSSIITTAAVQGVDQKNILIPSSSQATGVIQNVISQGHSTEIGQADGLAQNIIITEVDSNDQQVSYTALSTLTSTSC